METFMTARWRFEVQRRSQKSRDPMQASFFTNTSLENDAHALVREAIQNSLDARSTSTHAPAYVRFFIGNHPAQNRVMERYITEEAWLHFNSSDNGLQDPPNSGDDCRFLVYEDFNTDGLIGDERADKAGPNNSFYYFMRAEGQSGKEDEARGRHGIGKYVFPYTSRIRMFFALTVRSDDLRHLIAGQSVLKSHQVNKTLYTPDGWWGQFEDEGQGDYFQLPINDGALFEQMTADFSLNRNPSQSGLSLIMPYIQQDLKSDGLAIHVIREYFWPILNGQLVVETQEQGQAARIIDDSTISKILGELGKLEEYKESADAIRPCVELAYRALIKNDHTTI